MHYVLVSAVTKQDTGLDLLLYYAYRTRNSAHAEKLRDICAILDILRIKPSYIGRCYQQKRINLQEF